MHTAKGFLGFAKRFTLFILREIDGVVHRLPRPVLYWYHRNTARLFNARVVPRFDPTSGCYTVSDLGGVTVHIAHPRRLSLYRSGVAERLDRLADEYGLGQTSPHSGTMSVVVDCGANCGELGLSLRPARYVAFEPDPQAFRALSTNCKGDLFHAALGAESGTMKLYLKADTADSSLLAETHRESIDVRVETLDRIVNDLGLVSIDLLKIEAEGFEPEVLRGAAQALAISRLVALDVGPERYGRDTASECFGILARAGFELVDSRILKGRVLFRRELETT